MAVGAAEEVYDFACAVVGFGEFIVDAPFHLSHGIIFAETGHVRLAHLFIGFLFGGLFSMLSPVPVMAVKFFLRILGSLNHAAPADRFAIGCVFEFFHQRGVVAKIVLGRTPPVDYEDGVLVR